MTFLRKSPASEIYAAYRAYAEEKSVIIYNLTQELMEERDISAHRMREIEKLRIWETYAKELFLENFELKERLHDAVERDEKGRFVKR